MFELYQLKQLIAFADCGTLSKAAEALHLSQPALSRSMQKLEDEFQAPLFERQKNKIELNENGRLAVDCARKLLEQSQNMIEWVRLHDQCSHTLYVGSYAPSLLWELAPFLADLYPDMAISAQVMPEESLISGLQNHIYQIGLTSIPVNAPGISCLNYFDLPASKDDIPSNPAIVPVMSKEADPCYLVYQNKLSPKIAVLLQNLKKRRNS